MNIIKLIFIAVYVVSFGYKTDAQVLGSAQQIQLNPSLIEPLENYGQVDLQDGIYYKDVNNKLDPFLGSWYGEFEGKNLELEISVFQRSGLYNNLDALLIKYKLIAGNGEELENTFDLPDHHRKQITGWYFTNFADTSYYTAHYEGERIDCDQTGVVVLKTLDNPNEMLFYIVPSMMGAMEDHCEGNYHIMPMGIKDEHGIILTKQE